MAFTKRGLLLVEALGKFSKDKPIYYDTTNVFNKLKFTAANEDLLKATMTVDSTMCNGFDIMHGGFMSLVADVMCLYAHVAKTNGKMAYTTSLSINFIGTAGIGDKVIAEAKTISSSNNSSVMESILYKENGSLIAKGTACFLNANEQIQRRAPLVVGFDVLKFYE